MRLPYFCFGGIYMKANYNQEILSYAAEQSVQHSQFNETTQEFLRHRSIIGKLYTDYYKTILPGMSTTFNTISKLGESNQATVQNTIRMLYDNEKLITAEYNSAQRYIARLKSWALEGYKEIVSFRTFITGGQQLVYDVKDGSYTYRLTEEEYLQLLSAGSVKTWTQNWDSKSLSMGNLNNILALEVAHPSGTLKDVQATPVYLRNYKNTKADALYKYLNDTVYSSDFPMSRIYELYDQLRFSMFSDILKDSPITKEIFEARFKKNFKIANVSVGGLDNFVNLYKEAGLHKDTDAFYKMGDTVEFNGRGRYTLVENKLAGATVSIRTIKNAIDGLYNIVNMPNSKSAMAQKLKEFYTNKRGNEFAEAIQRGARREAELGIERTFKQMSAADIKITLNSS